VIRYESLRSLFNKKFIEDCLHVKMSEFFFILSGVKKPSQEVKDRLDFMLDIVQHLRGSYNNRGIRRWFYRKRRMLGGKRPYDFLSDKWTSDDKRPLKVMHLASRDSAAQIKKWKNQSK